MEQLEREDHWLRSLLYSGLQSSLGTWQDPTGSTRQHPAACCGMPMRRRILRLRSIAAAPAAAAARPLHLAWTVVSVWYANDISWNDFIFWTSMGKEFCLWVNFSYSRVVRCRNQRYGLSTISDARSGDSLAHAIQLTRSFKKLKIIFLCLRNIWKQSECGQCCITQTCEILLPHFRWTRLMISLFEKLS
jgi:hypothetical protein